MQKTKSYQHVYFRPEHIVEVAQDFRSRLDDKSRARLSLIMMVYLPGEDWVHDEESEFFSDIRKDGAAYSYRLLSSPYDLIINGNNRITRAVVAAPMRKDVEGVFQVIEKLAPLAELPVLEDVQSSSSLDMDRIPSGGTSRTTFMRNMAMRWRHTRSALGRVTRFETFSKTC